MIPVPVQLAAVTASSLDTLLPHVRAFYALFGYPYEEAAKRSALEALVADESLGRIYLVEQDGQCIGYVLLAFSFGLEFGGRVAFVDELYIVPSRRQRGIGSQVVALLESLCMSLGMKALRLETEPDNPRATALYMRLGFRDSERHILTRLLPEARS